MNLKSNEKHIATTINYIKQIFMSIIVIFISKYTNLSLFNYIK